MSYIKYLQTMGINQQKAKPKKRIVTIVKGKHFFQNKFNPFFMLVESNSLANEMICLIE